MTSAKKIPATCKKYLILKSDRDDFERFFIQHMQATNIDTYPIYKKNKGFLWYVQVIWIQKLNLPFQSIFYNSWKKKIQNYDVIIVFDRNLNWDILKWIEKRNSKSRKIAWLWNIVSPENILPKYSNIKFEIWCFDENECKKYGLRYNNQFYINYKKIYNCALMYDAIFVGRAKNRYNICHSIFEMLHELGYKVFEGLVSDKASDNSKQYIAPLPYEKVLELIASSLCIIDVPQVGQSGLTLRVLESLFLEKKLITTDTNIIKYDFYNPNNIFIWKEPTSEALSNFFASKYQPIDFKLIARYSFEQWIENFG